MKKIIIILFLAAVPVVTILSESNPHDSLLLDGENSVRTETYYSKSGDDCEYRVTYVKGNATGKIKKMTIYEACGADTVYEYENGAIEKNSVIKGGEQVKTGPESTAKIELSDGSVIVLGPNTTYTLPQNVCDILRKSFLESGSLWLRVKKLLGGGQFIISTDFAPIIGVRGTEFTFEVLEENGVKYNITKVYEGSVEVSLEKIDTKSIESKGDELTKLSEDFQAGKISLEEYSKKSMEITNELQNETSNLKLKQIIETGYMLRTEGKVLGDPVPFNTSDDNWFKISE